MKFLITLTSQKIGFFSSLAKHLYSRKHQIFFNFMDKDVCNIVKKNLDPFYEYEISKDKTTKLNNNNGVINEALRLEKKYNVNISFLISQDRALGRGYIINATSIPKIIRSSWSRQKKIEAILSKFYYYEDLLDRIKPDVILSLAHKEVLDIIAKKRGIRYYALTEAKFSNRYRWDDEIITSNELRRAISENLRKKETELSEFDEDVSTPEGASLLQSQVQYSYLGGFKESVISFLKEIYKVIRGSRKKNSYHFPGWTTLHLKRPYIYSYISKIGKKQNELQGQKIVYIPMTLEPEVSSLSISPEFTNQFEMIACVSKSLPADTIIVLKEQPNAYGSRPKWYYQKLQEMGNVVIAHPKVPSIDWIKMSSIVATITGTVGNEAILLKKAVLSFGKNQAINLLPTVKYCSDYESTLSAYNELIKTKEITFKFSQKVLYNSILNSSFALKDFELLGNKYSSNADKLAIQSTDLLMKKLS